MIATLQGWFSIKGVVPSRLWFRIACLTVLYSSPTSRLLDMCFIAKTYYFYLTHFLCEWNYVSSLGASVTCNLLGPATLLSADGNLVTLYPSLLHFPYILGDVLSWYFIISWSEKVIFSNFCLCRVGGKYATHCSVGLGILGRVAVKEASS